MVDGQRNAWMCFGRSSWVRACRKCELEIEWILPKLLYKLKSTRRYRFEDQRLLPFEAGRGAGDLHVRNRGDHFRPLDLVIIPLHDYRIPPYRIGEQ